MSISLCMIVKNEESVLKRCLTSIQDYVDEIIIVDTGSTDQTKSIAREFNSKIYDFEWIDDFSAARNFAFSKATKDYIMWLDADDVVSEKFISSINEINELLNQSPDVLMLPYNIAFSNDGNCTIWYYRERILKRDNNFIWIGRVHEAITPRGKISHYNAPIEHRPINKKSSTRNLDIYEKMIQSNQPLSSRDLFYYSKELYEHDKIDESIVQLNSFLSDSNGWVEDKKSACLILSDCYYKINNFDKQLTALYKYLEFDSPSAQLCCLLGKWYLDNNCIYTAIFWYKSALQCEKQDSGLVVEDYYNFIPYIWLCVCYDRIKNYKQAYYWNTKAEKIYPFNNSVIHNKKYFEEKHNKI